MTEAASPFRSGRQQVEPAWIDGNGHLNMAYYMVLFDRALDELFDVVGIGPDYVRTCNLSCFVAEAHTRYLREVRLSDPVRVDVVLVDVDAKRARVFMTMRHADDGWVAAECEQMLIHVDLGARKTVPFPGDVAARLTTLKDAHDRLPRPDGLGRAIGMRRGAEAGAPPVAVQP